MFQKILRWKNWTIFFISSLTFHWESSVKMKYETLLNGILRGGILYVLGKRRVRSIDFPFKNINIDEEEELLDVTKPPPWNAWLL